MTLWDTRKAWRSSLWTAAPQKCAVERGVRIGVFPLCHRAEGAQELVVGRVAGRTLVPQGGLRRPPLWRGYVS